MIKIASTVIKYHLHGRFLVDQFYVYFLLSRHYFQCDLLPGKCIWKSMCNKIRDFSLSIKIHFRATKHTAGTGRSEIMPY